MGGLCLITTSSQTERLVTSLLHFYKIPFYPLRMEIMSQARLLSGRAQTHSESNQYNCRVFSCESNSRMVSESTSQTVCHTFQYHHYDIISA